MPIPLPPPGVPTHTPPNQLYVRDRQNWAVDQERYRHDQALYSLGEYSIFYMMWSLLDFEAGLVARCVTCYGAPGSVQNATAGVYQQPKINKCPDCFGTTFEGGFRAKIVRPSLWADNDEEEKLDKRGVVHPESVSVESTWDFRMREGDYIVRADGSRWRLPNAPRRTTLRSGWDHPAQKQNSITYARMQARFEEPGTVAYMLSPTDKTTIHTVLTQRSYTPQSFPEIEVIRGPLIPDDAVID